MRPISLRSTARGAALLLVMLQAWPALAADASVCAQPSVISDLAPTEPFAAVDASTSVPVEIMIRPGRVDVLLCAARVVADRMRVRVVDGRLLLENRGGIRIREGDRLIVTAPRVDLVETRSAAPVRISGSNAPLQVNVLGPGPVSVPGTDGALSLLAAGDGPVTVARVADPIDVRTSGNGPVNLSALRDASGVVDHAGRGPLMLPFASRLRVTGDGTGPVMRR